jgi:hypothetical protein
VIFFGSPEVELLLPLEHPARRATDAADAAITIINFDCFTKAPLLTGPQGG